MPNFDLGPPKPDYTCAECGTMYHYNEDGWGPQSCPRCASTRQVSYTESSSSRHLEIPEIERGAMRVPYRVIHTTEKAALVAIPANHSTDVEVWVPFKHFESAKHTEQGVQLIYDQWFQGALRRDIIAAWMKLK